MPLNTLIFNRLLSVVCLPIFPFASRFVTSLNFRFILPSARRRQTPAGRSKPGGGHLRSFPNLIQYHRIILISVTLRCFFRKRCLNCNRDYKKPGCKPAFGFEIELSLGIHFSFSHRYTVDSATVRARKLASWVKKHRQQAPLRVYL